MWYNCDRKPDRPDTEDHPMRKGIKLMNLLLCAAMLTGLFGCVKDTTPEDIDGGTTTRIDSNAPKVIASKEITELDTTFYLWNRWSGEDDHLFHFVIEANGAGVLTVYEKERGISDPADDALLSAIQAIIDGHALVKENGIYDVTAGLPPEFFEYTTTVLYASGEKLTFTKNNDPEARWAVALYDLFADWFAAQGEYALEPEQERSELDQMRFEFSENGIRIEISGVNVGEDRAIDGQTYLLHKSVRSLETGVTVLEDRYVVFPADYYAQLTAIIGGTNLLRQYRFSYYEHSDGYYGLGGKTAEDGEADSDSLMLELHLSYASGSRYNIDTKKASEIEAARSLINKLLAYFDSVFA